MAIADLRQKVIEVKEASTSRDDLTLKQLQ